MANNTNPVITITLDEIAQLQDRLKGKPEASLAFQQLLNSKFPNPKYETHNGENKLVVDLPVKIMPSNHTLLNLVIILEKVIFKKPFAVHLIKGYGDNSTIQQFLMLQTKFESDCFITMLADRLELEYCTFQNFKLVNSKISYLSLEKSNIQGVAEFSKEDVYNNDLTTCNFKKTEFNGRANFEKLTFKGAVDFKDSELTNCNFTKTRFLGEADFKRAKFYGKNTFEYTQFNGRGAFRGAYFDDDPKFDKLILGTDSQMYFSELNKNFKAPKDNKLTNEYIENLGKKLKISIDIKDKESYEDFRERVIKQIVIKKFTIKDTIINGRMDFDDNNMDCLDMKGSVVAGTLSRVLFKPKCANWETATLLKHEELKIDNLIKALDYKAEEKDLYENELWRKLKYHLQHKFHRCIWNILKVFYRLLFPLFLISQYDKKELNKRNLLYTPLENKEPNIKLMFDLISLWLSKIANNHGKSWLRGIVFTLTVWFVFFGMFYIPFFYQGVYNHIFTKIYWQSIGTSIISGQFFSNMIMYFNPTNYDLLNIYLKDSTVFWLVKCFGTGWFLLGKALVPYGVFEVIQAFRKYNKID